MYGVDILDVFRGRVSARRVLALVEHLPADSATALALQGSEYLGWDRHAYLLADVFDAVNQLTYLTLRVNTAKPGAVRPPKPYPRPGRSHAPERVNRLAAAWNAEPAPVEACAPGQTVRIPAAVLARSAPTPQTGGRDG